MSSVHQDYFQNIISNMNYEDIEILGILFENNATSIFKSVGNRRIFSQCGLSEAKYRSTVSRLIALDFINRSPTSGKEHLLFLSLYGVAAFESFMRKESEVV